MFKCVFSVDFNRNYLATDRNQLLFVANVKKDLQQTKYVNNLVVELINSIHNKLII